MHIYWDNYGQDLNDTLKTLEFEGEMQLRTLHSFWKFQESFFHALQDIAITVHDLFLHNFFGWVYFVILPAS